MKSIVLLNFDMVLLVKVVKLTNVCFEMAGNQNCKVEVATFTVPFQ